MITARAELRHYIESVATAGELEPAEVELLQSLTRRMSEPTCEAMLALLRAAETMEPSR